MEQLGHPHRERYDDDGLLVGEDVGFCLYAAAENYVPKLAPQVKVGHVKSKVYTP